MFVNLYVNDLIFVEDDMEILSNFKKSMMNEFEID